MIRKPGFGKVAPHSGGSFELELATSLSWRPTLRLSASPVLLPRQPSREAKNTADWRDASASEREPDPLQR